MPVQVVVLKTNGDREELGMVPKIDTLQKIIGGYVELTSGRLEDGTVVQLLVNEDGDSLRLPYNDQATQIFHRNRRPEGHGDVLVGDVVMLVGCRLS
jgi:hypothetical protein